MSSGRLTSTALKERGWSDALIRDFAPPPLLVTNPAHRTGPPMRLWERADIERVESTEDFRTRSARVLARRPAARARGLAIAEARKRETLAFVQAWVPTVDVPEDREVLVRLACANYNGLERSQRNGSYATPDSDPEFLRRIVANYVRHCCTDYEYMLAQIKGRIGTLDAYEEIRAIVDGKVSEAIRATMRTAKGERS